MLQHISMGISNFLGSFNLKIENYSNLSLSSPIIPYYYDIDQFQN
jgi:hypothetical protein